METAAKKRIVTHHDLLRLAAWAISNKDRLLRDKPTREEAAALASKELDTHVTTTALRTALEFHGIEWTPLRGPNPGGLTGRLSNGPLYGGRTPAV